MPDDTKTEEVKTNGAKPAEVKTIAKKKVHPSRVHALAQDVTEWSVVAEAGTTIQDLLDPEYWTHTSQIKFRSDDILHVRSDDRAFYARLYVRSANSKSAQVVLMEQLDFAKLAPPVEDVAGYIAQYAGPHHKHRVVRSSDNKVIQHGFDTRETALSWLASNSKSLGA